jgi:O-antigen/teichoic acid export membrane protein
MTVPRIEGDAVSSGTRRRPPAAAVASAAGAVMSRWAPGLHLDALSWSLAVSVVAQASTFTMSCVLARVLGKVAFGEWAAIQSTVGTISGIAQLSMAVTATKFVAQLGRNHPDRAGRILAICSAVTLATGLVAAGAVALSAGWFAGSVLRAPHLAGPLRIAAASLLLLTINGHQVGALAGLERFRTLALLGGLGGVATAVLVAGLAVPFGLDGAVLGSALAAALTWLAFRRSVRIECRRAGITVRRTASRDDVGALVHFALPATLAGVAGMLAGWLSTLLIVRHPGGYAEMASLSAAATLRGAVLFAPAVVTRVSGPVLAGLAGAGALRRHDDALRGSALLAALSAAAVALPVAAGSPWLVRLFGASFQGSAIVVVVMAASGVFEAAGAALNQQFLSHGRMWWNLVLVGGRGLVLVAATYLLVPLAGAHGAAWAVLLAYGAALGFVLVFVARAGQGLRAT